MWFLNYDVVDAWRRHSTWSMNGGSRMSELEKMTSELIFCMTKLDVGMWNWGREKESAL